MACSTQAIDTTETSESVATDRLAFALCILLLFVGVMGRSAWTPDEPRVAAVALEMSQTGEIVVPHLAGVPFVEKPPLYFAVAAGFVRGLGATLGTAGAVRLSSAFWGLGALWATFFLGRRLGGPSVGLWSAALLGTMHGFVNESHWIRVDMALVFFVVAAVTCLAEVYLAERKWFLLPAGLLTAGAFLSKGVVGPAFVATGLAALGGPWLVRRWRDGALRNLYLLPHSLGLLLFLLPVMGWVLLFRARGGPELWQQWFWANQVGRMDGSAPELGHVHGGGLFAYLDGLLAFTLPWVFGLGVWLVMLVRDLRKKTLSAERGFLVLWAGLALLMLSVSATKRDLYLMPLLPVFAIMCAEALGRTPPRWLTRLFTGWAWCCVVLLAGLSLTPLFASLFASGVPAEVVTFLGAFSWRHLLTGLAAVAAVLLVINNRKVFLTSRVVAVTALAYLGGWLVAGKAADTALSMRAPLGRFVAAVPLERRDRVAGFGLTESAVGYLCCEGDWALPVLRSRAEARAVLAGEHPNYESLIINPRLIGGALDDQAYEVLAECSPPTRARRRTFQWIARGPGFTHEK